MKIQLSFRMALMLLSTGIILSLLVIFGGLLYTFHWQSSWHQLMPQVLGESARRVEQEMVSLSHEAELLIGIVELPIRAGLTQAEDFDVHVQRWLGVMEAFPVFRGVALILDESGEACGVVRDVAGALAVSEIRRNEDTGELDVWRITTDDQNAPLGAVLASRNTGDPRTSPWYRRTRSSLETTVTEALPFSGEFGADPAPGITLAAPVVSNGGGLIAVAVVSLSLDSLSRSTGSIDIGQDGFVFVLERTGGGPWHVIAHPNTDLVAQSVRADDGHLEMIPAEEFGDVRIREFMKEFSKEESLPPGQSMPGLLFFADGDLWAGTATRGQGPTAYERVVCTVVPAMEIMEGAIRNLRVTGVILLVCIAIALALGRVLARRITQGLEEVSEETRQIGQFHLKPREVSLSMITEVNELSEALETMKTSLRNFGRYVPSDLVRALLREGIEAELGGERRVMTIFFSDIAGFTSIAEQVEPEVLVARLAELNQALSEEIQATGGTIDKYIGDAVMAFWGAPRPDPEHARNACSAALRCQSRLKALNERWRSEGLPPLRCRMGIATGEVVVGNMGSQDRLNYTVLGDTVNLASRMEGLNRHCGTRILIANPTFAEVEGQFISRPIDRVRVKGRETPVMVYELMAAAGEADPAVAKLAGDYTAALSMHFERDWAGAARLLEELLTRFPDDGPSQTLLARCRGFMTAPPEDEVWVREMRQK